MQRSQSTVQLKKNNSNKQLPRNLSDIEKKISNFKKSNAEQYSDDIKEILNKGYSIIKDMNDLHEVKLGCHIKLKLKSTKNKLNNKIVQGGFLLKIVKDVVDGKQEHYLQLKSYNRIYRYNIADIKYLFYKEVTPNAKKIEILNKKIENLETENNSKFEKIINILKKYKLTKK